MPKLQAIVFDLDDTLYPEIEYVRSGYEAVGRWIEGRLGLPAAAVAQQLRALFHAGVRTKTFDHWLADNAVSDSTSLLEEMVQVYRSHPPAIRPFTGVPELLARLKERHRLGLLSDGYEDVQRRKLDALGIGEFFHAVVWSDAIDQDAWKPDPRPYRKALRDLRADAASSVYIADNPSKDFLGARRAGMWSIRIRRPDGVYAALEPLSEAYAPDTEIDDLEHLEALLANWRA